MAQEETDQDYAERLLRVLAYIEVRLSEELSPERLAKVAHFSVYHFHRVFRGIVGESVMEHISLASPGTTPRSPRRTKYAMTPVFL